MQYLPWIRILEGVYDELFRMPTVYTFHLLGKNSYSKFTKVMVFLLVVVIPVTMAVIIGLTTILIDCFDPAPQLVPAKPT